MEEDIEPSLLIKMQMVLGRKAMGCENSEKLSSCFELGMIKLWRRRESPFESSHPLITLYYIILHNINT